ncbi:MAG TPA: amidohydrolase family protein [Streptosporangiales bacterium]
MRIRHVSVLEPADRQVLADRRVAIENGRITAVEPDDTAPLDAGDVDGDGLYALPGLIDCHVHLCGFTADEYAWSQASPSYVAASAAEEMRATLRRGFTTVRDAGGADYGLNQAVDEGLLPGPHVFHSGKALSQTGGHADLRPRGVREWDDAPTRPGIGRIADGVPEVRRAARDEIRRGASFLKLMVSGGVSSPTDRIDGLQFSDEEIAAAVDEARRAGRYVAAHAYTADAVSRALRLGVRTIEHGNLIDADTAAEFAVRDAYYVPTLVAYTALLDEGVAAGMPEQNIAKAHEVYEAGENALRLAHEAGARIAFGTDLLGTMRRRQNEEFAIRARVQQPWDVLRSATCVGADLLGHAGVIGTLRPGALADVVLVRHDPSADVTVLADPEDEIAAVLFAGTRVA